MKNFLLLLLLIGCTLSGAITAQAQSPTITSPRTATTTVGQRFTYQFEATGATLLAAANLPPGLTFNLALSAIVGNPTAAGTFQVGLSASNAAGTTTDTLSITVQTAPSFGPTIISATSATVRTGQPYSLQVITQGGSSALRLGTIPLIFFVAPAGLVNISTRTTVGTSENVLLGGFVITGNAPKRIMIRAIGPSLTNFGTPNALADPTLQLRNEGGALLLSNDNWRTDQEQDIFDTGLSPSDDRESAILTFLNPGKYTAIVRGKANTTGKAVVEVYDFGSPLLDPSSNSQLVQVSTRGFVNSGDEVMIGGFIIQRVPTRVAVRALGPSLSNFGISGALADPTLELRDASGVTVVGNDDWQQGQPAEIQQAGLAPSDTRESALIAVLQPGQFTAVVSGKGGATGVALVEVYALPQGSPAPLSEYAPFQQCSTSGSARDMERPNGADITLGSSGGVFLMVDPVAGLVSGVGASDASLSLGLTVRDGNATGSSTLQITSTSDPARPVILSSSRAILAPGEAFSYTIVAPSNADPSDPTIFRFIGTLPPGLTFNAATGTISGTYAGPLRSGIRGGPYETDIAGGALLGSIQLFGTNSHGTSTLELRFEAAPSGVANISTRTKVLTDDRVLIGGFIISGTLPKVVIVRAIGPSTGIPGLLEDPTLTLLDSTGHVVVNDNWKSDQEQLIRDTGLAPADERESAIVIGLDPGRYTATVEGKNGATGSALVAVDDLGTPSFNTSGNAKLGQISTRGLAGTGDDVMIGGFIIRRVATRIVVRGIGPSLSDFGVSGALPDPTLEIKNASGSTLIGNDDWQQGQPVELQKAGLAPSDSHESAVLATLPPGQYTAIVNGKGGATGVALVEVYVLE